MKGRITLVGTDPDRVYLDAPALAGDTVLTVLDGWPLAAGTADGDQVTTVRIGEALYSVVTYTEGVEEDDPATVFISPGLVADAPEDEPVVLDPPRTTTFAYVAVDGMDETVKVLVPQELQDAQALTLGPRGTYTEQEPVEFEDLGRGPELTWVEGRLVRDGTYLDPDTVPQVPPTDGNPPETSPTLELIPGLLSIFLRITPVENADPVTYDVYANGALVASTPSTLVVVSTLADSSPLPLDEDTTFYAFARDDDGTALEAGPSVSGRPRKVEPGALADEVLASIDAAMMAANGAAHIIYSDDPASNPLDYSEGDTWYRFDDDGLLIGQWRHDGTDWVPTQIANVLLGDLDAARITAGFLNVALLIQAGAISVDKIDAELLEVSEVYGKEGYFGKITAENLSSIITFSTLFRTAEAGQRGEWDVDSLRFYDSANRLTTRISGTDSFFSGDASIGNLETRSATLGGPTLGPPGAEFKIGSQVIDAPALPPDHVSVAVQRLEVSQTNLKYITSADAPANIWKTSWIDAGPTGGAARFRTMRFTAPAGAYAGARWIGPLALPTAISGAINSTHFFAHVDGKIYSIPRGTTGDTGAYEVATIAAPGVGGYGAGDPVIGTQKTTGHLLVAHRVQGAQTIAGQVYADKQVMVRKYTVGGTSAAPTLTLNRTIDFGLLAEGPLSAVVMDNTSGVFDMPASAGNTGLTVSSTVGFAPYLGNVFTVLVPNAGAAVITNVGFPGGAKGWYDHNSRGVLWDGANFWTTDPTGDAIRKYNNSDVAGPTAFHSYTYWNGTTQETKQSPRYSAFLLARHVSEWTIPALPAGVTRARIYVGAVDDRTRMERVGSFTGTALQPLKVTQTPIAPPAGAATNPPPDASNLVNGGAYRMYDVLGNEWDGATGLKVTTPTDPLHPANKAYVDGLKLPIGKYVASGGAGNTNTSGFVTVTISPPLPYTPAGFSVNATNSGLHAAVDLGNSSASSIRVYFRTITTAGSPVLASANPGPFSWLAYP